MASSKITPDVSYEATVSLNDEGDVTCLVYKSIRAGICGPHGEAWVSDLPAAERWLKTHGYSVGHWRFVKAYDGLRLVATLGR